MAGRTGALEREEALRMANAALAAASRAVARARAALGAGARAGLAGDRSGDADLGCLAGEGFGQGDFHVVAQVCAPLASGGAAAPAAQAEQIIEDVGKARCESGAEALAAGTAVLERGMAEAIVRGALVAVLEDVVGLADLLEPVLAILVAGIAIGMVL